MEAKKIVNPYSPKTIATGIGSGTGLQINLVMLYGGKMTFTYTIGGWTIARTTEPWAIKFGNNYEATNDGKVLGFATLQEAIEWITEIAA